ncbi:MAG: cell division protein ZapA, partial [Clostridiales bacterium]
EDLKNKGEDLEDAASQEQATQDVATQDETSPEEDQEKKALGQGKADFSASDGQKEKKTFNKMRVNVCGQLYNLRSEDSQEHLQRVADLVENKIEELRKHFADYSLNKLIMLAILQLADEKIKLEEDHEHLLQSLAESGISIDLQAKE